MLTNFLFCVRTAPRGGPASRTGGWARPRCGMRRSGYQAWRGWVLWPGMWTVRARGGTRGTWRLGRVTAFSCESQGQSGVQGLLRFKPLRSTTILGSCNGTGPGSPGAARRRIENPDLVTPSPEGFRDPTVPSPGSETEKAVLETGVL